MTTRALKAVLFLDAKSVRRILNIHLLDLLTRLGISGFGAGMNASLGFPKELSALDWTTTRSSSPACSAWQLREKSRPTHRGRSPLTQKSRQTGHFSIRCSVSV